MSTPARPFSDLVTIGRLIRPQGRRGELLTESFSDCAQRFPTLRRAFVPDSVTGSREVRVLSCWPHKGRFVLKLDGVDDISAAEAYRGVELGMPEDELPALPPGSYYYHQLIGLHTVDATGAEVGHIESVLETGAGAPVLTIRRPDGAELLLPMVEGFLCSVDLPRAQAVVAVPELVEC